MNYFTIPKSSWLPVSAAAFFFPFLPLSVFWEPRPGPSLDYFEGASSTLPFATALAKSLLLALSLPALSFWTVSGSSRGAACPLAFAFYFWQYLDSLSQSSIYSKKGLEPTVSSSMEAIILWSWSISSYCNCSSILFLLSTSFCLLSYSFSLRSSSLRARSSRSFWSRSCRSL